MSDREHHCPFLNRADHRCSDFFSIEQLQHAFEHCFHAYKACAVYQELLVERQARRGYAAANTGCAPDRFVWATACGAAERNVSNTTAKTTRFVQVRLPTLASTPGGRAASVAGGANRYPKPVA
jgi:hypothetical protein